MGEVCAFLASQKLKFHSKEVKSAWVGGSGSCRLNLLAEFKINVKKVDGGSLRFFGFPEVKVSQ